MKAARVDKNHGEIIAAYRQLGYLVLSLAQMGHGCPDALVWRRDVGFKLVEIKTLTGKLRPAQVYFQALGWPVTLVRSVDDLA